jgi:hypothetical protein
MGAMTSRRPLRRRLLLALPLALAGCGGGVWWGIGGGDDPPDVSLAADVGSARAGEIVRLVAAASDDFGIDRVDFLLDAGGGATLLARVAVPPYRVDVVMPSTTAAEVLFFARAVDDVGQATDSQAVSVAVIR